MADSFFFIEMGIALGGQVHHDSVTKDSRVVGVGWERGVGGGGRWTGGIGGGWIITMGDGGRASSYSCNSDRPLIYYLSLLSHISFILLIIILIY